MPNPPPDPNKNPPAAPQQGGQNVAGVEKTVQFAEVAPELIDFDFDNPRLTEELGPLPKTNLEVIQRLLDYADLTELLRSIAQNGFLPFDEMVVLNTGDGRYCVLEGNRRLAAIRLLKGTIDGDKSFAEKLKVDLPILSDAASQSLEKIPVKVVKDRDVARAYIGFKHINGPQKWDALAKAKYASAWMDKGASLVELAKTLGDTNAVVRRLVFGFRVLEQSKKSGFRVEDINNSPPKFFFSHLYTALSQAGFQKYLGINSEAFENPQQANPIPEEKMAQLQRLMGWLYGSKPEKLDPVIRRQHPELGYLNKILSKQQATSILESTRDFKKALEAAEPKAERFVTELVEALNHSEKALGLSSEYDGSDPSVVETSDQLAKIGKTLQGVVKARREERKDEASKAGTAKVRP